MNTNIEKFITSIITFDSVENILKICKNQSEKGFLYERLWDVCIKFGFCKQFPNSEYMHMVGNVNNGSIKPLDTFTSYMKEKVCSSNSGGCSDITLLSKTDDTHVFITSKYPKSKDDMTKQKSVDYYDIQKLIGIIDHNKHVYKKFDIYLLVPNKTSVLEKIKHANKSSDYITKYMKESHILDKNDLNKCFLLLKEDMLKHNSSLKKIDYDELYLSPKCQMYLRFHQSLITQKTSNLIEEGEKRFLWGCKCRCGKTYMVGALIANQFKFKGRLNALIITPAPTETTPQFTNDLFNKFREFKDFTIHNVKTSKSIESIKLSDNNIFVISKQLLQKFMMGG